MVDLSLAALHNLRMIPGEAVVSYLKPLDRYELEKPYILGYEIPLKDETVRNNLEFEEKRVPIYDVRCIRNTLSVDQNGFELLSIPQAELDRYFSSSASSENLEGVACLLRSHFATEHIFCYDHAVCSLELLMALSI